jgi:hypothetical protein
MRSKAPPPMSARGAMQFRRDGAKRSSRNGAAELSEARARRGKTEIRNHKLVILAIRARRASIISRATTNAMKNRNK